MARIQSLVQQRFLERQSQPTSSKFVGGLSGTQEGVPKMHPLKSSLPSVMKSTSMIHGLRMQKPKMLKMMKMAPGPKMLRGGFR